jgi:DNA-directed RNA polymerase beta subunit
MKLLSYIPEETLDSVREHGLLSGDVLAKPENRHLLELARPGKAADEWLAFREQKLKDEPWKASFAGPSAFFGQPDTERIKGDATHPMNQRKSVPLRIDLEALLRDAPDTRLHGVELAPGKSLWAHLSDEQWDAMSDEEKEPIIAARHHDLKIDEIKQLIERAKNPKELWKHFEPGHGRYAGDVPHVQIIHPTGKIDPKYLEFPDREKAAAMNLPAGAIGQILGKLKSLSSGGLQGVVDLHGHNWLDEFVKLNPEFKLWSPEIGKAWNNDLLSSAGMEMPGQIAKIKALRHPGVWHPEHGLLVRPRAEVENLSRTGGLPSPTLEPLSLPEWMTKRASTYVPIGIPKPMPKAPMKSPMAHHRYLADDDEHEKYAPVGIDGLLAATEKLLAVNRGLAETDDRDSLPNDRVHTVDRLMAERIKLDHGHALRAMMGRLSRMRTLDPVGPDAFGGYTMGYLKSNPLVTALEEINPMHILEQKRRITKMGPGGIGDPNAITDDMTAVSATQFGFVDPIAGPESEKAGIDVRLAHGARVGSDGRIYQLLVNRRTGKKEWVSPSNLRGKTLKLPD